MTAVHPRRMAVELDGDFVVYLVGMRINKPWKLHKWWPVFRAMRPMLRELDEHPEAGCLGYTVGFPVIVMYWRSYEHLETYARSIEGNHWPAWVAFNKRIGRCRGDVGVWHETYQVRSGEYDAIYSGMPRFGLGKAGTLVPAAAYRSSALGQPRHVAVGGMAEEPSTCIDFGVLAAPHSKSTLR